MSFDKVDSHVDFPAQERATLEFWDKTQAFEKLREKNAGKPRWSFLDGPMTANNPMGVHHAWGRTYKDAFQRYHAMNGKELRYQNGYDCQGLWVEVEVEKQMQLKSKVDIENLVPGDRFASIDKFVQACKDRVDRFSRQISKQSVRLGYWMDWDTEADYAKEPGKRRSYFTMGEENNYTIWSFLKKCHHRDLVYKAFDAMPWCPRCAVGLSQMEMHEGYKLVAHRALYVKFPIRGRVGENLLVWTTTPWTLTSNVGAAVNPELTYVKVKHADEIYYVAKGALTAKRLEEQYKKGEWPKNTPPLKPLAQLFKEKGGYEIVAEIKGAEMLGWTYDGPFDEVAAQQHEFGYPLELSEVARNKSWCAAKSSRESHRVLAWSMVGETEGTGIVHIAPGCGKEDFELGKKEQIPLIAPLDENGIFLEGFGALTGKAAYEGATVDAVIESLKAKKALAFVEQYPHNYPHCWRCSTELLFRLVDEWYIDMKWRDEIMKVCHDIRWIPEFGLKRELDWLANMGDWMISKKRYWGLALPIWVCPDCATFEVIGGREELKEKAVEGWEKFDGHSPHRPWIDMVKIKCPKCGAKASRVGDVGNPWLDAGIVPYSTMGYNSDKEHWKQWFPADFITECFPGQFRNWFYALLAMSTMMENRAPFKTLLGHALVRDEKGEEMHKSKGNSIPFDEAAEKMGADLMRWMFCRANPTNNINFGYKIADDVRNKFTLKLWNTYSFFCNYARLDNFDANAAQVPLKDRPDIDRWILSDLQLLIKSAREGFETYNVASFCVEAERFVDDKLSNWYVRRNRRRFWKSESGQDKLAAYQTLYTVLTTLTRLISPVMPFLAEALFQNLVVKGAGNGTSVHHEDFPTADESMIDKELSDDMAALLKLVTMGSAIRNNVKIKVRQPIAEMKVIAGDDAERRAVARFAAQITEELNIKKASLHDAAKGKLIDYKVKPNFKTLGPKMGTKMKEAQAALMAMDAAELAAKANGSSPFPVTIAGEVVTLDPVDVVVEIVSPEGFASIAERATVVSLDTRITEELKEEGLAREVVRYVQNLRKTANLELDDRIVLGLVSDDAALTKAVAAHKAYIMAETLATDFVGAVGDGAHGEDATIDGVKLRIEIKKA